MINFDKVETIYKNDENFKSKPLDLDIEVNMIHSWEKILHSISEITEISARLLIKNRDENISCTGIQYNNENSIEPLFSFPLLWPDGSLFGAICIRKKNHISSKQVINLMQSIKDLIESHLVLKTDNNRLNIENNEIHNRIMNKLNTKGIPVICSYCKKIKSSGDTWDRIEHFFEKHYNIHFSHGICPECSNELFDNLENDN